MTFSLDERHRDGPSRNKDKEEEHEGHDGRTNQKGKDVVGRQWLELEHNDTQAMEGRKMDKSDPQQEACSTEGEQ